MKHDPRVYLDHGVPKIAGVEISRIVAWFAYAGMHANKGLSLREFLREYCRLTEDDVRTAVRFQQQMLFTPALQWAARLLCADACEAGLLDDPKRFADFSELVRLGLMSEETGRPKREFPVRGDLLLQVVRALDAMGVEGPWNAGRPEA